MQTNVYPRPDIADIAESANATSAKEYRHWRLV